MENDSGSEQTGWTCFIGQVRMAVVLQSGLYLELTAGDVYHWAAILPWIRPVSVLHIDECFLLNGMNGMQMGSSRCPWHFGTNVTRWCVLNWNEFGIIDLFEILLFSQWNNCHLKHSWIPATKLMYKCIYLQCTLHAGLKCSLFIPLKSTASGMYWFLLDSFLWRINFILKYYSLVRYWFSHIEDLGRQGWP